MKGGAVLNISKDDLLKFFSTSCNMTLDDLQDEIESMNKKEILKQHPYKISQGSDGRYKTHIKDEARPEGRRLIAKSSLVALQEAIIEAYNKASLYDMTLEQLYKKWMFWRKEIKTETKTMKENSNEWKRFIANKTIASTKVRNIDIIALNNFFMNITNDHSITYKRMVNVKSLLNGMFKYAVIYLNILPHNPMNDMDFKQFRNRCKPENSKKENYTQEERQAILDYLSISDEVYSLAIQLAFHLSLRIGELVALKREDIIDNMIYIRRSCRRNQQVEENLTFGSIQYTIEERMKGNQAEGFRAIPLSTGARIILDKAIKLNPTGEYLFMRDEKPIIGDTFNEHLKRTCNKLNIPYRSSHQIRFTSATMMLEGGISVNQISTFLGHSNTQTTFHYIRQRKADQKTADLMQNIFG